MFRISVIVCISLIFGITAKPYKPWEKIPDAAYQDTVMSIDAKGKMSWGVEVEPPQDMDETDFDIDPSMAIWKSMIGTGQEGQYLKAEEDKDELYHPSMEDLKAQIQTDTDDIGRLAEPEQDWDEVYHGARDMLDRYFAPLGPKVDKDVEIHPAHTKPEEDEDDLYHSDPRSAVQVEPLGREFSEDTKVRIHLEPEEDMDDLYHMDPLRPIPYQDDAAAMPVDQPSLRKHSEPEEDLDDLYHH
ncbi:uncharacterized protein LOC115372705 [Myripristis murdjan]|uniref:uncharacterized protein LOC115372705 n=1 Tax=Myripristis murdjan TaxID=586833 RepID=UPI001176112D|nr:uncharacterized protein LOC115372705 [Myripristis murdjan]